MRLIEKRLLAACLSIAMLFAGMFSVTVQAEMISAAQVQTQYDKAELLTALEQAEIQQQLISMGVDVDLVKDRVNHLTADELAMLNTELENMPAGSGVVGLLVLIFLVFVITDILGATDVFPFVNSIE